MFVAILPAAGESRRMGRAKLLLPWRGTTLLGHLVASLRAGGVERQLLVARPDDAELAAWVAAHGVELAINPDPGRGMLSSVWSGLEALGGAAGVARLAEGLVVGPADHPAVAPATIGALLAAIRRGALLAVPAHGGRRGHPLAIAAALAGELPALDPGVGLRQLAARRAADLVEVAVDDPGTLLDVDTEEDYRRLCGDA